EVHHHHVVPQAELLEVAHQVLVHHRELARQVRLDRQVAEAGLDRGIDADDVGDGGGGGDGHAVGVAHAVLGDAGTQAVPVHRGGGVGFDVAATLFAQQLERVDRQDAAIPQR